MSIHNTHNGLQNNAFLFKYYIKYYNILYCFYLIPTKLWNKKTPKNKAKPYFYLTAEREGRFGTFFLKKSY